MLLLTLLFIALKLAHIIAWSWLLVLAPVWIPFAIYVVLALVFACFARRLTYRLRF